ncbi:MAG: tetratricopeptide repeat protein, partial [Betaproteobacteria bacterium]
MAEPHTEAVGLLQTGRFSEALLLLEPACLSNPADAHAWFLLGACRHSLRDLDSALAAFDRAIALDPSNLQAAQAAIAVLCDARRPAEALARCENLLF